jgi:hypothetical protein
LKEDSHARAMTSVDESSRPGGPRGVMYSVLGFLLQRCIEWLVRLTGRRVSKANAPWLDCVIGQPGRIGVGIYQQIANEQRLELSTPSTAGLILDFSLLQGPSFDASKVHPRIRHFYEHTAAYQLEVWSEVYFAGKFVLWLLVEFISQQMDQLNFPISSLEVAKGMTNEIVHLRKPGTGKVVHVGWLRRFRSSGKVIYAGLYSVAKLPGEENPCVKVTFPCYGSSSVYLRPCVYEDGSFGLLSKGNGFGCAGFYRVLAAGRDGLRVRNFKTLHEIFHVYVDGDVLRTDHEIKFVGLTVLRLHYKMTIAETKTNDEVLPVGLSKQDG